MFGMDFIKFILIASAVLFVCCLGVYAYLSHDLGQLENDVQYCFHRVLPDVGKLSSEIRLRQEELDKDKKRGIMTHRYVEERAKESNIRYQEMLKMSSPRDFPDRRGGFVDSKTEISPSGKKDRARIHRQNIAQFLFLLENRTNCLKVTTLALDRPSEDRQKWNMRMTITERTPFTPAAETP